MHSARNILSPTKQNQLPSGRGSPFKIQNGNLNQILLYLKQNGVKLPAHLISQKNPQEFSLKLNTVSNSTKTSSEVKALKIRLCDIQFQLKKIEQDYAQYKRTVKIQKDKQHKKYTETLQKIETESKQNAEDYDYQKQRQIKQHSEQLEKIRCQYSSKLEKLQIQLTLKHSAQVSKLNQMSASEIQSIQIQLNKKYSNLQKQLNQQIQSLKRQSQKQKYDINLRNKEKIQQNKKRYQSNCLALQSQKRTQEKLHQKSKIDAQKQKQRLFGQLCYEKNVRKNLENQLVVKQKETKQFRAQIHQISIKMEIVKENAAQQKKWMIQEHQKQIQHTHDQYQIKIKKILDCQSQACLDYQGKMQRLNNIHQGSQKIHESKLQDLSDKFKQRVSKQEDLDQIKKFINVIVIKDQQIKKLTRQLRYRNLQIENKEQVYNKIFKNSTRMRQQKKMAVSINKCEYPVPKLERNSWSKESLFRRSQTDDVKIFLNNMVKTKRQKITSLKEE